MARILTIHVRIMLLLILALVLLQGVLTCDASVMPKVKPGSVPGTSRGLGSAGAGGSDPPKTRSKRCTCYSYTDKECVYYCHLDIIWINTPERTVPYGMSSYQGPQRVRRAAGASERTERLKAKTRRCVCTNHGSDAGCEDFCLSSPQRTVPVRSLHRVPGPG